MKRALTQWSGCVLGLAVALAPIAASGNANTFSNSEGCEGSGLTTETGTNLISSQTSAHVINSSTGCNWVYLVGNYQDTEGTWYYGLGPGWIQLPSKTAGYLDCQAANYVGHSACNPGGPCPYASYIWTSYPP